MQKRFVALLGCLLILATVAMAQTTTPRPWDVEQVQFTRDGKRLLSNAEERPLPTSSLPGKGVLQGWDVETGRLLFSRTVAQSSKLVFAPDGELCVSAGLPFKQPTGLTGNTVVKVETGEVVCELEAGSDEKVLPLTFSADGKLLAGRTLAHGAGRLRLWDTQSGKQVSLYDDAHDHATAIGFSPDNQQVIAAVERLVEGQKIELWMVVRDRTTGAKQAEFPIRQAIPTSFFVSANGRFLVDFASLKSSFRGSKSLTLWDAHNEFASQNLKADILSLNFKSLWISPDGRHLKAFAVSASCLFTTGYLLDWDLATGKPLSTVKLPQTLISQLTSARASDFSPDGTLLALSNRPGDIKLVAVESNKVVQEIKVSEKAE